MLLCLKLLYTGETEGSLGRKEIWDRFGAAFQNTPPHASLCLTIH
jgi:hypothetical protein